jgi:hypothetical protein
MKINQRNNLLKLCFILLKQRNKKIKQRLFLSNEKR